MKKIKIFIGSSIDELKNERNELARFVQGLNNKYLERGVFFEGYFCEESSSAMQIGGSQKQHNDYIENDADAAIFMFFQKAGQFTLEELELARKTFLAGRRPDVFIFFKAVDSYPAATEEIKACVDKVANDYGHYFKMFESTDTIKLELLQFIVERTDGLELKVQDGKVFVGEELVENIKADNIFAYQNNPNIKKLKAEIEELLGKMTEASSKGDATEMLRISVKLNDVQNTYHTLEKDILEMLNKFTEENKKGKKANPRRMEALRLLESGKIEEAKSLISQEELNRRTESFEARKNLAEKTFVDEANEIIEDAIIRIQALKQDIGNSNRFAEIETVYDSVYETAQTAKRYDFIYDFASFLHNQKNYIKGISVAEKLKYLYDNPEDKYLKEEKARLLELLGHLYNDNRDFEKAETALAEVIDIYNGLSKTKKEAHARADLANLYTDIAEYDKAEELYREALEILNNCAEADESAEVADICNCFALFYEYKNEVGCAERLFLKSLYIFRKLAETDIIEYEYDITKVCSNLANLYTNTGRLDEAEKLFFEALEIRRRLAETVSKSAYSPGVALICNNLAVLYDKTNKTKKAEEAYTEALNIYRDLAETINKAAYEPLVAEACRNLACFYDNTGRRNEAEKLFSKALEIRRRLAETISMSAYESVVADTCYDFGLLYLNANNKDNAKIMLEEALSIYTHINEEILRVADVCRRLAFLYGQNEAEKAADYLLSAINIYIGISKQQEYKEEYEPYVALTCSDLGSLYMVTGRLVEGLKLMRTAFNIAAKYKDVNPKCREIYDALS